MTDDEMRPQHPKGSFQQGSRFSRHGAGAPANVPLVRRQRQAEAQAAPHARGEADGSPYSDPARYVGANRSRHEARSAAKSVRRGVEARLGDAGERKMVHRPARGAQAAQRVGAAAGKPSRKRRPGRIVLLVLLGLMAAAIVAYVVLLSPIDRKIALGDEDSRALSGMLSPSTPVTPYYALLLGSDRREDGDSSRTDTIMVARVDPIANKVTLVSVPRDTKVEVPGHGTQKINAAYAFGGVSGEVAAVEDLLGIRVSQVAVIDFDGLSSLIDAIGGVTVNVPVDVNDPDYTGLVLPAGTHEMDGATATLFSRVRHGFALGDYQRQADQRLLMQAIVQKLRANPTLMPAAANALGGTLSTTYHCYDLIPLLLRMSLQSPTIWSASIPSSTAVIGSVSYVIADEDATMALMATVDAGGDPSTVANGLQEGAGTSAGSRAPRRKG
ncbi:LCP family protein [Olsenella sp. HMSC062G07]|uniref:LCP family protein n=1 Tax=Olsenella sp. HMSC062G07 TaxID=1739330 RepID=UPI0008BF9235|nr:LCP family protein [Olsenella sp. HMSC062G07]OFK22283.1 hypothetical protein HMPREF2826_01910 [Olsenella sp. HMSC062G07]